jgi:hypothetical protein
MDDWANSPANPTSPVGVAIWGTDWDKMTPMGAVAFLVGVVLVFAVPFAVVKFRDWRRKRRP